MKLIAETAWHHEGDFDFLLNLAERISLQCSPDFLKFHVTLDFDEYMSKEHEAYSQLFDMTFSKDQWSTILDVAQKNRVNTVLLFNDTKAVEFGMNYNPSIVEIHSVCLNDIHLLDALKRNLCKETKVMLGVGGSTLYEIEKAIDRIGTNNIILMHGFQNFPTKYADINFRKIQKIMNLYPNYEHGYADHTAWNEPNNILITLMGAALGMNYLEKHVTTEYGMERIDYSAAISFDMFNELKQKLAILSKCFGNGLLEMNDGEKKYSQFGPIKKAAFLREDVEEGDILTEDNLHFKRTNKIVTTTQLDILNLLGYGFRANYEQNTIITNEMVKM